VSGFKAPTGVARHEKAGKLWSRLTILALAVTGAALVLVGTSKYGAGLSPDSVNYIAAARGLLAGRGYVICDGTPFVSWAPLYPSVLAVAGVVFRDPLNGARFVNAACLAMLVLLFGFELSRLLRSRVLAVVGTLALVASVQLLTIAVMAWSEMLFLLLIMVFLSLLWRYVDKPTDGLFVLLVAAAALCSLQRYIGAVTIGVGALFILTWKPGPSLRARLGRTLLFVVSAAVPILVWLVHNMATTSLLTGNTGALPPRGFTLGSNLSSVARGLTNWFLVRRPAPTVETLTVVSVMLLVGAATVFPLVRLTSHKGSQRAAVASWAVFLVAYLVALVAASTVSSLDPIADRFLSPIYALVIMLILAELDDAMSPARRLNISRYAGYTLVMAATVVWLWAPLGAVIKSEQDWVANGAGGYNTTQWRDSPLIAWLKTHDPKEVLYSNAPDAVYILTGQQARMSPASLAELNRMRLANGHCPIAWFVGMNRYYLMKPDEIARHARLQIVREFPDGFLYALQ
jgi:hypothetical protein